MRIRTLALLAVAALTLAATGPRRRPAIAGGISGKITFTGTPPKMHPIDMAKEPSCAARRSSPARGTRCSTP
jgi:hypothetical protein